MLSFSAYSPTYEIDFVWARRTLGATHVLELKGEDGTLLGTLLTKMPQALEAAPHVSGQQTESPDELWLGQTYECITRFPRARLADLS